MFRYRGRVAAAILPALLASAATLGTTAAAHADLRLCNQTPVRVGIAIGYKGPNDWVSEGWWNIDADSCQVVVDGPLPSRYYYLYALDYEDGGAWGGTAYMCTDEKEFTIEGTEDCVARGYQKRGFVEVDTRDKPSWTVQLTERPTVGIGGR
jgi:uncharacterized membrane protein